jgi:hypothetical protein
VHASSLYVLVQMPMMTPAQQQQQQQQQLLHIKIKFCTHSKTFFLCANFFHFLERKKKFLKKLFNVTFPLPKSRTILRAAFLTTKCW